MSKNYLNPIAACQTKANSKKKTGIIGKTSTIGLKIIYASGNLAKSKLSMRNPSNYKKINIIKYSKFNNINFTIKKIKKLTYLTVLIVFKYKKLFNVHSLLVLVQKIKSYVNGLIFY